MSGASPRGTLYLVPTPLDFGVAADDALPPDLQQTLRRVEQLHLEQQAELEQLRAHLARLGPADRLVAVPFDHVPAPDPAGLLSATDATESAEPERATIAAPAASSPLPSLGSDPASVLARPAVSSCSAVTIAGPLWRSAAR